MAAARRIRTTSGAARSLRLVLCSSCSSFSAAAMRCGVLSRSRPVPSYGDEAAGHPTAVLSSRLSRRHGGCCFSGLVFRGVVKASGWLGAGQLAAAGFAVRLLTRNSGGRVGCRRELLLAVCSCYALGSIASGPGGRWGRVVFGWRALRPPRVVFVLTVCLVRCASGKIPPPACASSEIHPRLVGAAVLLFAAAIGVRTWLRT